MNSLEKAPYSWYSAVVVKLLRSKSIALCLPGSSRFAALHRSVVSLDACEPPVADNCSHILQMETRPSQGSVLVNGLVIPGSLPLRHWPPLGIESTLWFCPALRELSFPSQILGCLLLQKSISNLQHPASDPIASTRF